MYDSEIKKLINLIKERKALYDHNDKQYSNRTAIDKVWMEIGVQMNVEASECKRKWICLRNSYARYLRELRSSDLCGKQRKQWYMADAMSFLKEYVNLHPSKISTLSNANAINPDDESQSSPSDSSTSSNKNSPLSSKKCRTSTTEMEEAVDEVMMPIMKCEPSMEYVLSEAKEEIQSENSRQYEAMAEELQDIEYEKPRARKRARCKKSITERKEKQKTRYSHSKTRSRLPPPPSKETKRKASLENGNVLFFKSLLVDYENLSRRSQRTFRMYMLEKMNELQEEEENR